MSTRQLRPRKERLNESLPASQKKSKTASTKVTKKVPPKIISTAAAAPTPAEHQPDEPAANLAAGTGDTSPADIALGNVDAPFGYTKKGQPRKKPLKTPAGSTGTETGALLVSGVTKTADAVPDNNEEIAAAVSAIEVYSEGIVSEGPALNPNDEKIISSAATEVLGGSAASEKNIASLKDPREAPAKEEDFKPENLNGVTFIPDLMPESIVSNSVNVDAPFGYTQSGQPRKRPLRSKAVTVDIKIEVVKEEVPATSEAIDAPETPVAPPRKKRVKRQPGDSPFPDYERPTAEECCEVARLLSLAHGAADRPDVIPDPDPNISGCGEVPSVLDALLRTILSAATSNINSTKAFTSLSERFGRVPLEDKEKEDGVKKYKFAKVDRGSVNWYAVKEAPVSELFDAIKCGGLGDMKSKTIKTILDQVWEEGQERKKKLREVIEKGLKSSKPVSKVQHLNIVNMKPREDTCDGSDAESALTDLDDLDLDKDEDDVGELSLEYIRNMDDLSARQKLTSFKGVGVKTASCVMLYCLNRDSFAVDTHVWRLTRDLGWVPQKATPNQTFLHLETKIPHDLKYPLHNLFIRHGRSCKHCRAGPEAKNPPKPKKEKVEFDESGEPIKKKKVVKKWVGNGVMKQTLIEVDSEGEGGEQEMEDCVLEHLVTRVRAQRKDKKKTDGDSEDEDENAEGEAEVKPKSKSKKKRARAAEDTHSDTGEAGEPAPKPKRARNKTANDDDSDYAPRKKVKKEAIPETS